MVVRPATSPHLPAATSRSSGAMTMVESSRKHGRFDGRYPVLPKPAARTWVSERADNDGDQLDWSAFLGRFFRNRRRHDRAALAAYEAHMQRLAQGSANRVVPKEAA